MTTPEDVSQPRRRRPARQQEQEGTVEQPALHTPAVTPDDTYSAIGVEQQKGGPAMVDRITPTEVFSQLINRRQPRERGLLAPELTPEEHTLEQRQHLISNLLMEEEHLLSVLRLMRPDILKEAFEQIGDVGRELQQMAYLEWLHGTFQMLSQVAKLTQYSIEIQKQSLQDAGIDVSRLDQQAVPYTALTQVFQRLGERLVQRAQGMQLP